MTRVIYRITDSELSAVTTLHYDIAIFASGSEPRCTYIAKQLSRDVISYPIVVGFDDHRQDDHRLQNDEYYSQNWSDHQIILKSDNEGPIYQCLQQAAANAKDTIRILVDYSSMSRLWYAGILNWALHTPVGKDIEVEFLYAVGEHKNVVPPLVITEILSIPGCQESPVPLPASVVVFGLGFDGLATLCILDRLEPNAVYAYLASPAAFEDYPERARSNNEELIQRHSAATLELPLTRVEATFRYLTELISPHRGKAAIVLVPMGPKPHVLAAILLSMRFKGVGCLDVNGRRERPERVGTTGDIVVTKVELKPQQ